MLPAAWSKSNPIDIIGDAKPDRYGKALEVVLADANTDALLVMNCPTALADSTLAAMASLDAIARHRKRSGSGHRTMPVLTNWLGDGAAEPARAAFREKGIPAFATPDDAINGFMQLVRYTRAQNELMRTPPALPDDMSFDAPAASAIMKAVLRSGRTVLTEIEAKALLAAYGIPTVPTKVATTPDEVMSIANDFVRDHGSVVVKIVSRDITHKSDAGGVRLDLETAADARQAAARYAGQGSEYRPRRPHRWLRGATDDQEAARSRAHCWHERG